MDNIQFHRSTIGLFLDKAQSLLSKLKGRLSIFVDSSKKEKVVKISIYLNVKIALIVLMCVSLLIQEIITGIQLKCGDIETISGQIYNLEKIVLGPSIREIVNYLLKLQAFNVHVMHDMHYVGFR